MDFQWHVPTEFHFSAVSSKGLSLVQWIYLLELSNGFSVVFSNIISLFSVIFKRVVTCAMDDWNCPMDFQWHVLLFLLLVSSGET